jgi:hypothetical protein
VHPLSTAPEVAIASAYKLLPENVPAAPLERHAGRLGVYVAYDSPQACELTKRHRDSVLETQRSAINLDPRNCAFVVMELDMDLLAEVRVEVFYQADVVRACVARLLLIAYGRRGRRNHSGAVAHLDYAARAREDNHLYIFSHTLNQSAQARTSGSSGRVRTCARCSCNTWSPSPWGTMSTKTTRPCNATPRVVNATASPATS